MGISLSRRPNLPRVGETVNSTYSISSDGYGTAVLSGGSGLTNGMTIYIFDCLTSYNGFCNVAINGPNTFRMINLSVSAYTGTNYTAYTQGFANVKILTILAASEQIWSCVHLPIIYKLLSNRFPTNTADTTVFVTAFYNDNGYIKLTLSSALTNIEELDWLTISGTSVDELDGDFQVLTKHSTTQYTINAPYELAGGSVYVYASASAVKHYHNYAMRLRVYAGLEPTHAWAALKPYALITEEAVSPGSDNFVFWNVADKVKQKVGILYNRPNYDSMPYDLDRFCKFYISYAETYDVQGEAFTSAYQSDFDFFQGIAVDAKLEFKNRYSGFLSGYVYASAAAPAKFLTYAERPVLFEGFYFDLSLINSMGVSTVFLVQKCYSILDVFIEAVDTQYSNASTSGILRMPVLTVGAEVYQKVILAAAELLLAPNSSGWTQSGSVTFTTAASTFTGTSASASLSDLFVGRMAVSMRAGDSIGLPISLLVQTNSKTIAYRYVTSAGQTLFSDPTQAFVAGVSQLITCPTTVLTSDITWVELHIDILSGAGSSTYVITVSDVGLVLGASNTTFYSEEKTIDVNQDCGNQYIALSWKNPLGGFDYWVFLANKVFSEAILGTQTKDKNVYPGWSDTYGTAADSITQETSRTSAQEITVRSQTLTQGQLDYVKGIKLSHLVQQMTSKYDRRTVLVDSSSFSIREENQLALFTIEFTIRFTNENASQSL